MVEQNAVEVAIPGLNDIHLVVETGDFWPEVEKALKEVPGLTLSVSIDRLALEDASQVQCFVVAAETEAKALTLLQTLRRHLTLGLLPAILVMPSPPENIQAPYYDALLMPPFSPYQFKKTFIDLSRILTRCNSYAPRAETFHERAQREIQVFRFFHSRDLAGSVPQRDKCSPLGYSIPWADDLLRTETGGSLWELNRLAMNGLFLTELQDRINICPQCNDYRINFRQVCPHCGSPDVSTQGTIQHFTCAHVAPEKNFIQHDKYICPKCGKQLKHIGVDYTKPGEVVVCDHCGEASQEANVSCLSLICGAVFPPERAKQVPIYQYRLSQMGLEAAVQGFHSESDFDNILKSFLNIYALPFFEKYLQLEMQRSLRYKSPFSLINLSITNLPDLDKTIGLKEKTNLIKELEMIFGTYLRSTDLITLTPEGNIYLLLVECNELRAESTIQRILNKSKEVLSIPLEFKYHITCVPNQTKDFENVKQLLNKVKM